MEPPAGATEEPTEVVQENEEMQNAADGNEEPATKQVDDPTSEITPAPSHKVVPNLHLWSVPAPRISTPESIAQPSKVGPSTGISSPLLTPRSGTTSSKGFASLIHITRRYLTSRPMASTSSPSTGQQTTTPSQATDAETVAAVGTPTQVDASKGSSVPAQSSVASAHLGDSIVAKSQEGVDLIHKTASAPAEVVQASMPLQVPMAASAVQRNPFSEVFRQALRQRDVEEAALQSASLEDLRLLVQMYTTIPRGSSNSCSR